MTLKWLATTEIRLCEALIEDPNSPDQMTATITGGRIAIADGFVHIDSRPEADSSARQVTMVPSSGIRAIAYQMETPASRRAALGAMKRVIG